jgi:flagellar hook-basal body complex protein FliE
MDELKELLTTPMTAAKLMHVLNAVYAETENVEFKEVLIHAICELQTKEKQSAGKSLATRKGKRIKALVNFIEEGRINPPLETKFDDTVYN